MSIILLSVSLAAVILSANALVNGASSLAKRFKISDIVIGLTIVSIGTSMPELTVSILSALKGNTDIAVGNVLGSNIANILLILGISAIVFPVTVQKNTQYKEIPLGILAIALIGFCGNDIFFDHSAANVLTRTDGIVLLCFFIIFLYYTFQIAGTDDAPAGQIKLIPLWRSSLYIVSGIAGLYLGGKFFVDSAVKIARYAGMSDSLIGLTIVAIGTSLPELATSIIAATKKNSDIAVGNVVGSNIINVFMILGFTAVIKPLPMSITSNIDVIVALVASLLLFLSTFTLGRRKITRTEGIIFVSLYLVYFVYLIIRG